MRVALAQLDTVPGDFAETTRRMLATADRARGLGADVLVFPVTTLTGTAASGVCASCAFELDMLDAIDAYAARASVATLLPTPVRDGEASYVEVFLCHDGVAGPLRLGESRRAGADASAPEEAAAALCVNGAVVQVGVDGSPALTVEGGADLTILCPTLAYAHEDASTLMVAGLADGALRGLVEATSGWVAALQGVGGYDDAVLAGGSFAVSPEGVVVAACPTFDEGLVTFDVAVDAERPLPADAERLPQVVTAAARASADSGDHDAVETAARAACPPVPGDARLVGRSLDDVPTLGGADRRRALWDALTLATRDFVRKRGMTDAVVGLSGDAPSVALALLAVDALGPDHVRALVACDELGACDEHAVDADRPAALAALVGRLGVTCREVRVAPAVAALAGEEPLAARARAALVPSLRAAAAVAWATGRHATVLSALDKTAASMGWETAFGSCAGDFAPLSDLYRSQVARLVEGRLSRAAADGTPLRVGPWATGRETSSLDRILYMHVERGMDASEIVDHCLRREDVVATIAACHAAECDRRRQPVGPIVSLAPLVDLGWPMCLGWVDDAHARDGVPAGDWAGDDDGDADAVAAGDGWDDATDDAEDADGANAGAQDDGWALPDDVDARDDGAPEGGEAQEPVAARLDAMLARLTHQDQTVGTVGDIAFTALVSGIGPDMEGVLGMPIFSKN